MSTAPLAELRELITLDQAVAIAGLRSPNEPPLAESNATHEVGGGASLYGQPPSSVSPSVLFMYRYISRESCSQFDSLPLTYLTHTQGVPPSSGAGGAGVPSPSAAACGAASGGMLRASSDAADGLVMQLNDSVITLLLDALAQSDERSALRSKYVDALAADR